MSSSGAMPTRKTREGVPFREVVERALLAYSTPMSHETTGTRTAAIGAGLENLIAVTNKCYERLELGVVLKNEVRKSVINGRLVFKQKSTTDFTGFLREVGFISFDCKTTREKMWRMEKPSLHQFLYMLRSWRWMRGSGLAHFGYLIEFRQLDTSKGSLSERSKVYWVGDERLESLAITGTYRPDQVDLVGPGEAGLLLDYREKILASMEKTRVCRQG